MILFRPVGIEELGLIHASGMREFPPRRPEQPIFYPVLNEAYGRQIAADWNTASGSRTGFVTRFVVADDYVVRFERRVVGSRVHEELWVPADQLREFNERIEGEIEVIAAYFGAGWAGLVGDRGRNACMLSDLSAVASARGETRLACALGEAAATLRDLA